MPVPGFYVMKNEFGVTGSDGKLVFHSDELKDSAVKAEWFQHKGFQLKFPNGWTLSVMFGYDNYCEHRNNQILFDLLGKPIPDDFWVASPDAEIADFPTDKEDFTMDEPRGWCSPGDFWHEFDEIAKRPMYVKQPAELVEA